MISKQQNAKIGETEKLMWKNNARLNNLKFQTTLNCHIFKSICDRLFLCICHQDLQGQESICRLMK